MELVLHLEYDVARNNNELKADREARLHKGEGRLEHLTRFLEQEVWTEIPPEQWGRRPTLAEEDQALGHASDDPLTEPPKEVAPNGSKVPP